MAFFSLENLIKDENYILEGGGVEGEEDEYDALNDETFGTLDDVSNPLDDWEEQHKHYAEISENSKQSERLENAIRDLVHSDDDEEEEEQLINNDKVDWSYQRVTTNNQNQNGDRFNVSLINSLEQTINQAKCFNNTESPKNVANEISRSPNLSSRMLTLEEIEANVRAQKKPQQHSMQPPVHPNQPNRMHLQGMQMQQQQNMRSPMPPPPGIHHPPMRMPPGFNRMMGPMGPPPMRPPPHLSHMYPPSSASHPNYPPFNNYPQPPHPHSQPFMRNRGPHNGPPPHPQHPPSHMIGQHSPHQMQQNHHSVHSVMEQMRNKQMEEQHNMMLMHRYGGGGNKQGPHLQQHLQQQLQQQQHQQGLHRDQRDQQHDGQDDAQSVRSSNNGGSNRDEYAGLMTNREKHWLLNIQQLQLNTGTPYFDDYYYSVFKDRKMKNNNDNQQLVPERLRYHHNQQQQQQQNSRNRNHHHQQENHHQHHHHQQQQQQLTPRVYTPLQFENSLGKLQLGSVTAPRKIIDMDLVTLEKDSDGNTPTRDTRKTKQLLLELEGLYTLLLKAEDLRNPVAIANTEKLIEIKFKQRIREMEAASTAEQKQELLKLIKQESTAASEPENPFDYVQKIIAGLMQEDKFASFLNIRKGKILVLRVLPLLSPETFTHANYLDLWSRILLCIPLTGRRDAMGDHVLPQLHPYFKRFVQSCEMSDVLDIVGRLEKTMIKQENNSRSTPLSHQARAPLLFVLGNKFGVSALVTIFVRTEYLASSGNADAAQLTEWCAFLANWADSCQRCNVALPIELIPRPIFVKHCNRFPLLGDDKRRLLDEHYVEVN